ncbi:hypothetical protein EDC04DRAFT_1050424 [Pisolithus marmoratus]|nr:hypothetical protein EDC04DRAFT_1050424 [Pisolithus marmoratus]
MWYPFQPVEQHGLYVPLPARLSELAQWASLRAMHTVTERQVKKSRERLPAATVDAVVQAIREVQQKMLALRATGEVTKLQVGSTLNSKRTKLSYKEVCKECRNMPVRRHASGMVFFPVRTSVLFFRLVNAVGESGTLCRCPEPPSPKKIAGEKHDHGVFAVKIGLMNFARSNVMKSGSLENDTIS